MQQFGLIGYPLTHSFSPSFFEKKFAAEEIKARYTLFPLTDITQLPILLHNYNELAGLNVTIPYKSEVIPLLNFISVSAQEIGAVNCIKIIDQKLYGFNTDYLGFAESLQPLLPTTTCQSALVLGSGGSSKAVQYALKKMSVSFSIVSHTGQGHYTYEELTKEIINKHLIIINTTPLGMYPNIHQSPAIPYDYLTKQHLLFDLIYNPEISAFLKEGLQRGTRIKNGSEMLHLQADKSWGIWLGQAVSKDFIALR